MIQPGFSAPREFPIISVTANETITPNGLGISQNPQNQQWPPMLAYANSFGLRHGALSMTPSSLDKFQNYSDGIGSTLNPLLGYGQSDL